MGVISDALTAGSAQIRCLFVDHPAFQQRHRTAVGKTALNILRNGIANTVAHGSGPLSFMVSYFAVITVSFIAFLLLLLLQASPRFETQWC